MSLFSYENLRRMFTDESLIEIAIRATEKEEAFNGSLIQCKAHTYAHDMIAANFLIYFRGRRATKKQHHAFKHTIDKITSEAFELLENWLES